MVTGRMEQIDSLIMRELAIEISRHFPEQIITVTQVHVTKDLAHAKIWVTSPLDIPRAVHSCQAIAFELRKYLAGKIVARKVPSLHFVEDNTSKEAMKIEELVRKIKDEEKNA